VVLCAAGYNFRWLPRAMVRLGLKGFFASAWALLVWFETALSTEKSARPTAFKALG